MLTTCTPLVHNYGFAYTIIRISSLPAEGRLLGYVPGTPNYIVLISSTRSVTQSRDVIFDKTPFEAVVARRFTALHLAVSPDPSQPDHYGISPNTAFVL